MYVLFLHSSHLFSSSKKIPYMLIFIYVGYIYFLISGFLFPESKNQPDLKVKLDFLIYPTSKFYASFCFFVVLTLFPFPLILRCCMHICAYVCTYISCPYIRVIRRYMYIYTRVCKMHARMCTRICMYMRIYVCRTHIHARQGTLLQFFFSFLYFISFLKTLSVNLLNYIYIYICIYVYVFIGRIIEVIFIFKRC